jgi:UDP-N-acetylmuramoylalanine--D-glutamate ligase
MDGLMMELKDRRVMVIGLGVSGLAAAHFLAGRGAALVMAERRSDFTHDRLPAGELHLGSENPAWLNGVDLVVVSPGVPPTSPLMVRAATMGIPVIGELELGFFFVRAPIVAVTGTNGKSTVTELIGAIFRAAGKRTFVGGNLGTPLITAADGEFDVAAVEVSSYQLETILSFKPAVAIHLNLTDDHLDRYRDLAEYGRAKARIFENQETEDWAVLNRDDGEVWKLADSVLSRIFSFGMSKPERTPAIWCEPGELVFDDGKRQGRIATREFKLHGDHNLSNAMAAAAAALAMDVEPKIIERAFAGFSSLPHRLEFVRAHLGAEWIDDSKGTNVGAVVEALAATRAPVILIAGGVDKGGDYAPLRSPLGEKVKLLILLGAAREKMRNALAGVTAIECVPALTDAIRMAASRVRPGDTVLLSPACSSFDQFKDYADRGRVFQELVRAL